MLRRSVRRTLSAPRRARSRAASRAHAFRVPGPLGGELGQEPALEPLEDPPEPRKVQREELLEERDIGGALHEGRAERGAEVVALGHAHHGGGAPGVRHLVRGHADAVLAQKPCELDEARLHGARL
jgi:hypothetical protein